MSNADLHKLPPQSLEAEMSILGGILIDNDAINRVLEMLLRKISTARATARSSRP